MKCTAFLLLICICALLTRGAATFPAQKDTRAKHTPLFADLEFRRGFYLSYSNSSRGRQVAAVLQAKGAKEKPMWRLCQWGTNHTLAGARPVLQEGGDIIFENVAKRVVLGSRTSKHRDLVLEIRGRPEYGQRARSAGESWPHLLVEQDALTTIPLSELSEVGLRVKIRLLTAASHMVKTFDPSLHTAQFQLFFIVKNINPDSRDHRDFFWFGVPFYDWRYDISPPYMAKDGGKKDATGKFIYTIAGREVISDPLKNRQWAQVGTDLLPHIIKGLREAVRRKYLSSVDPKDYAVVNMNMGWELPGNFTAAVQVRDLDLSVIRKKP